MGECSYRHICCTAGTSGERFRFDKSTTNTKVTQLDIAFRIEQYIGWLDILIKREGERGRKEGRKEEGYIVIELVLCHRLTSMNHLMMLLQVIKCFNNLRTGKQFFKNSCVIVTFTLTETHILHTISSGMGPAILFSSRSRQVDISSMKTHTSF